MSSTPSLFKPIKVGSLTLPNRIGMSALTRNRAPGTVPNDLMKEYYVQRKDAGLIVTEGILIVRQGTEWPHAPGLWGKEHVAGWKNITDAVHAAGGRIYAQLWHLGRASHPDAPEQKLAGTPVYAPSAVAARGGKFRHIPGEPGYVTPTAVPDPRILIEQFKVAAQNAKEAGFDGVELHGANGYLINQFLDSTVNKRTDEWGGSVENRARFGLETLKALKEVFGPDVAVKVSPAGGYNDVGMPLQETIDTYKYYLTEIDKLGLAFVTFVRYSPIFDLKFDGVGRATVHDIIETHRGFIKNTPVFANCGFTPEEAESFVSSGKIDGVFFGFSFITHPDLVKRLAHNKPLSNPPDIEHLQWGRGEKDAHVGYTDYPEANYD